MGIFSKSEPEPTLPKMEHAERLAKMPTQDVFLLAESSAMEIGMSITAYRTALPEDRGFYLKAAQVHAMTALSCFEVLSEREGEDAYK